MPRNIIEESKEIKRKQEEELLRKNIPDPELEILYARNEEFINLVTHVSHEMGLIDAIGLLIDEQESDQRELANHDVGHRNLNDAFTKLYMEEHGYYGYSGNYDRNSSLVVRDTKRGHDHFRVKITDPYLGPGWTIDSSKTYDEIIGVALDFTKTIGTPHGNFGWCPPEGVLPIGTKTIRYDHYFSIILTSSRKLLFVSSLGITALQHHEWAENTALISEHLQKVFQNPVISTEQLEFGVSGSVSESHGTPGAGMSSISLHWKLVTKDTT